MSQFETPNTDVNSVKGDLCSLVRVESDMTAIADLLASVITSIVLMLVRRLSSRGENLCRVCEEAQKRKCQPHGRGCTKHMNEHERPF